MDSQNFTDMREFVRVTPGKSISLALIHRVLRIFLLILDTPFFCLGKKISPGQLHNIMENIQLGDIILYTDKNFPIWRLIMKVMGRSDYNHAGIYEGNGYVIEATTGYPNSSGVVRTNIGTFLSGYKSVCILRPPYGSDTNRLETLNFAKEQLGKPYDFQLDLADENSMYCTELVAKAIRMSGITTPLFIFNERNFYRPDDFLEIENIGMIYEWPMFWTEMLQHILFPICFVIAYAILHSKFFSPGTLAIYCIGGFLLNIFVGWLQYIVIRRKSILGTIEIQGRNRTLVPECQKLYICD